MDDSTADEVAGAAPPVATGTRADAVTGAVLVVLGLMVAFESWRMPTYTQFGNSIWSAPGVVPGLVGLVLALLGAILASRGLAGMRAGATGEPAERGAWARVGVTFGLCVLFAGVAVGCIPFSIAAALFLFAFIALFDHLDGRVKGRTTDARTIAMRLGMAAVIAVIVSLAVTTVFEDVFLVRLP